MPAFDANLMFKSSGNLTETETSSALNIRGTPQKGLGVYIAVPSTPGLSGQVLFTVNASLDNSTYRIVSTYRGGAQSWASGGKEFMIPISLPRASKYVKLVSTITNGSTATSFGAMKAGLVNIVTQDWTRGVDFS